MRSAYERGFDVVTLTDCTATLSQEAQDMALTHNFGMFSRPMNHDAFLKLLAPGEPMTEGQATREKRRA